MRATQNNGINIISVLQHQLVDAFLYEIISPGLSASLVSRWQPKADKPRHSPESLAKVSKFPYYNFGF